MARLYLALFSFIFCQNFYLNGAEQQLSNSTKANQKRVYAHRREKKSFDDFDIPKIQPQDEGKKRRVLSTSYKISPASEKSSQSKHSSSAPTQSNSIISDNLPAKALSDSSVNQNTKKKHGYSPLNMRHKKKSSPTPLAPIAEKPEHILLIATRNLNINQIKFYLSGKSFNPNKPRDKYGNTAFHIIAAQKNKLNSSIEEDAEEKMRTATAIIDLFLKDYRADFSIINNAGSTPRELLSSDRDTILRTIFFSRCSLNILVNKYAEKLKDAFSSGSISPEVIEGAAQHIVGELKDIEAAQAQQKDRALPSEAAFPVNVTIYFIEQILRERLDYITDNN